MPDTIATALLAVGEGPGDTLRIVLLVSIVGGALLAWFLLRGYRDDAAGTVDGTGGGRAADGTDGNTERDANA
ncbi:hypothetical protein [Streptomyces sp. NPDC001744]|uniref:hypothetical protein n=1 Tax=Streptomyces sp. NPDC001744 TaxID=3364606 RepID=UPI0036AA7EB2